MSNSNENIKQLYDCILFSWGSYVVKENNLTYLPILLDHGQTKISTHVRLYLKKLFDCIIAPLSFTQVSKRSMYIFFPKLHILSGARSAKIKLIFFNFLTTVVFSSRTKCYFLSPF